MNDGTNSERDERGRARAKIVAAQREKLLRMRDAAKAGDDAFYRIEGRLDRIEVMDGG